MQPETNPRLIVIQQIQKKLEEFRAAMQSAAVEFVRNMDDDARKEIAIGYQKKFDAAELMAEYAISLVNAYWPQPEKAK